MSQPDTGLINNIELLKQGHVNLRDAIEKIRQGVNRSQEVLYEETATLECRVAAIERRLTALEQKTK
jgi:hypothetical protein